MYELPETDRKYYRTVWGFDPNAIRQALHGNLEGFQWRYETGYPIDGSGDEALDEKGITIWARVDFTDSSSGESIRNRIVFKDATGQDLAQVACIHTAVFSAPLADLIDLDPEKIADQVRSTEHTSLLLRPEEHYVALCSFVDAFRQLGVKWVLSQSNIIPELPGIPLNTTLQYQLVKALREVDRLSGLECEVSLEPRNPVKWNHLGVVRDKRGDITGAIADFRQAVDLDPEYSRAWTHLGIALSKEGDLIGAVTAYERGLELDPENPVIWRNLKFLWRGELQLSKKLPEYESAVLLDPDNKTNWNFLGAARGKQGDLTGAVIAFERATELDPEDRIAWYNLGFFRRELGDFKAAVEAFERVISLDPENLKGWVCFGLIQEAKGDYIRAIEAFERAFALDPENPVLPIFLNIAHKKQDDHIEIRGL